MEFIGSIGFGVFAFFISRGMSEARGLHFSNRTYVIIGVLVALVTYILQFFSKKSAEMEANRIMNEMYKKQKQKEILEQQAADERQRKLREIEEEEAARSRGRATGMAQLYKTQIDLLIQYKREGLSIEKDIYLMREKLLELERNENTAMIHDLMKTLDSL